jgi:hypothetical protein
MLDPSKWTGKKEFFQTKDFVLLLLNSFYISPKHLRIIVVTFNKAKVIQFNMFGNKNQAVVDKYSKVIQELKYVGGPGKTLP